LRRRNGKSTFSSKTLSKQNSKPGPGLENLKINVRVHKKKKETKNEICFVVLKGELIIAFEGLNLKIDVQ